MCLGFSKHRTLGKQIQQILTPSPHCTWWGEYQAHAVFQSSFTPSNPRVRLCFHLFHTTAAFLPHLFLAPSFILCFLLSVSHSFIFSPSLPWKNHSEHNRHKTWIQSRAAPPSTHAHTHTRASTTNGWTRWWEHRVQRALYSSLQTRLKLLLYFPP